MFVVQKGSVAKLNCEHCSKTRNVNYCNVWYVSVHAKIVCSLYCIIFVLNSEK
jgi:hypothetical protein